MAYQGTSMQAPHLMTTTTAQNPVIQGAGGLQGSRPPVNYQPQTRPYQPPTVSGGAGGSYSGQALNRGNITNSSGPRNMADFQQFQDASYNQAMRRFNPIMDGQRRQLEQAMVARGIQPGTQAYDDAFANMSRQHNDMYGQAAFGAQQAGLAAQNQFAQQDLTREGFANQRSIANIGAGAQRYAADARNRLGFAQLDENARQYDGNLGFNYAGLNEQGRQFDINDIFRNQQLDQQGMFGLANLFMGLNGQNMQQQAMQNGFNNQWFNQAGGLVGQAPGASFTPVGGLTNNVLNAQNMNNQIAAGQNAALGQLIGAGAAAFGGGGLGSLFSDERLKKNIKYVGRSGPVNVYEFEYKDAKHGKGRFRGVLAQQVAKMIPSAVGKRDGYLTVDYSQLPVDMVSV